MPAALMVFLAVILVPLGLAAQTPCRPDTVSTTTVQLYWRLQPSPPGVTQTNLMLYQQINDGPQTELSLLPATATGYRAEGLVPGDTLRWSLVALGTRPDGSPSTSPFAKLGTPPPCVTVEAATPPPADQVPKQWEAWEAPSPKFALLLTWNAEPPGRKVRIDCRQLPDTTWTRLVPSTTKDRYRAPRDDLTSGAEYCCRGRYLEPQGPWTKEACAQVN